MVFLPLSIFAGCTVSPIQEGKKDVNTVLEANIMNINVSQSLEPLNSSFFVLASISSLKVQFVFRNVNALIQNTELTKFTMYVSSVISCLFYSDIIFEK